MAKSDTKLDASKVTKLANLPLSDAALEEYQVVATYESLAQISELDLDNVSETARVNDEENIWREDQVGESFSQTDALLNAKQTHEGFFVVPSIFENRES